MAENDSRARLAEIDEVLMSNSSEANEAYEKIKAHLEALDSENSYSGDSSLAYKLENEMLSLAAVLSAVNLGVEERTAKFMSIILRGEPEVLTVKDILSCAEALGVSDIIETGQLSQDNADAINGFCNSVSGVIQCLYEKHLSEASSEAIIKFMQIVNFIGQGMKFTSKTNMFWTVLKNYILTQHDFIVIHKNTICAKLSPAEFADAGKRMKFVEQCMVEMHQRTQ